MPPGREDLYPILMVGDRERIIAAMADLAAKRGFRHTTLELIQQRADVSRAVFRRHFKDREDCLLQTIEASAGEIEERVNAAVADRADWQGRLVAGAAAVLEYAGEKPNHARVCLVESAVVRPAGAELLRRRVAPLIKFLRGGRELMEDPSTLPDSLEESIVGALLGMTRRRLERSESDRIPELLPTIVRFAALPYLGAEEATRLAATVPSAR